MKKKRNWIFCVFYTFVSTDSKNIRYGRVDFKSEVPLNSLERIRDIEDHIKENLFGKFDGKVILTTNPIVIREGSY